MSGYQAVLRIRQLEDQVAKLGMRMAHPKSGYYRTEYGDTVALYPLDQEIPIFSRDAELFVGTLEEMQVWLQGVEWARRYDTMLRISDDKKRTRKEQDEKNRKLMKQLKEAGQEEEVVQ